MPQPRKPLQQRHAALSRLTGELYGALPETKESHSKNLKQSSIFKAQKAATMFAQRLRSQPSEYAYFKRSKEAIEQTSAPDMQTDTLELCNERWLCSLLAGILYRQLKG